MSETVIEHFGVKGMHWGVRKSDPLARNIDVEDDPYSPGSHIVTMDVPNYHVRKAAGNEFTRVMLLTAGVVVVGALTRGTMVRGADHTATMLTMARSAKLAKETSKALAKGRHAA